MPDRRPLSAAEIDAALAALPDWRADAGVLHAGFATATVADALALIAAIGVLAEELDHHPDVDWRYRHVFVRSTTHSAGGRLTGLDVALAERVSVEAARLGATAQ
jgi:4a-hydroxytetrahydrobiopterin dehydratase